MSAISKSELSPNCWMFAILVVEGVGSNAGWMALRRQGELSNQLSPSEGAWFTCEARDQTPQ